MQTRNIAIRYRSAAILILLIAISVCAPLLKQQIVTGIIVNAVLFTGAYYLNTTSALLLGILPSSVALAVGLLSPVLAPMVPFIIIGNAVLVLTFSWLLKLNFWVGGIVAGILKFAFLYGMSFVIAGLILNDKAAASVTGMMGLMQLITAFGGFILAGVVIKITGRR